MEPYQQLSIVELQEWLFRRVDYPKQYETLDSCAVDAQSNRS